MKTSLKKIGTGFMNRIAVFFPKNDVPPEPEITLQQKSGMHSSLSHKKRAELHALCRQLLKKKEFIASGKLQFIGLDDIRKKLGKKWSGLRRVIYETAEECINNHTDKNDLVVRYHDDAYLIVFAYANMEEAKNKITAIATEIHQRLFALDDDDLKSIEIRQCFNQLTAGSFLDSEFPELQDDPFSDEWPQIPDGSTPTKVETTSISTEGYRKSTGPLDFTHMQQNIRYSYTPLWEVKRGALTTYLCLPFASDKNTDPFESYTALYRGRTEMEKLQIDLGILKSTLAELAKMQEDGRRLLVMCPVRHQTVHAFETYEIYKAECDKIPENYKPFLTFLITDDDHNALNVKDPYWFVHPLRRTCCGIFAEVSLQQDVNFQNLKHAGLDAVGVRLDNKQKSEQDVIGPLNNFSPKAKYFKISKTFALDVKTLSATTFLVCGGFDYVGGSAVHEQVPQPDTIHRYQYEDLLSELLK